MERAEPRAREWRFVIEVRKGPEEPLRIRLREGEREELSFASWEALYHYLAGRFPEWLGYLR